MMGSDVDGLENRVNHFHRTSVINKQLKKERTKNETERRENDIRIIVYDRQLTCVCVVITIRTNYFPPLLIVLCLRVA